MIPALSPAYYGPPTDPPAWGDCSQEEEQADQTLCDHGHAFCLICEMEAAADREETRS